MRTVKHWLSLSHRISRSSSVLNLSRGGGKLASAAAAAESSGFGVFAVFIWAVVVAAADIVSVGALIAAVVEVDSAVVGTAVDWIRGVIVSAISAAVVCCWDCWALGIRLKWEKLYNAKIFKIHELENFFTVRDFKSSFYHLWKSKN